MNNETQRTRDTYDRNSKLYDLLELPLELLWYRKWRRRLFSKVGKQSVLEVGIGTGRNLPYYPDGCVGIAIDLSEGMLSRAAAKKGHYAVSLRLGDVQRLPFSSDEFDVVVATFVFCSVPDPVAGLREVHRVLKPDGRLLLLEHVLPQQPWLARLLNALNSFTVAQGGVHINRRTAENIRKAGFELVEETDLLATIFRLFVAQPGGDSQVGKRA
jgi:ubiquinone/menaquinone biosynthesis C-methylase UbiE